MHRLRKDNSFSHHIGLGVAARGAPVCPLTPRAAPVAVKSTMASRIIWMLCSSAERCSPVSCRLVGSSDTLHDIGHEQQAKHCGQRSSLFQRLEVDWELALCAGHFGRRTTRQGWWRGKCKRVVVLASSACTRFIVPISGGGSRADRGHRR